MRRTWHHGSKGTTIGGVRVRVELVTGRVYTRCYAPVPAETRDAITAWVVGTLRAAGATVDDIEVRDRIWLGKR